MYPWFLSHRLALHGLVSQTLCLSLPCHRNHNYTSLFISVSLSLYLLSCHRNHNYTSLFISVSLSLYLSHSLCVSLYVYLSRYHPISSHFIIIPYFFISFYRTTFDPRLKYPPNPSPLPPPPPPPLPSILSLIIRTHNYTHTLTNTSRSSPSTNIL